MQLRQIRCNIYTRHLYILLVQEQVLTIEGLCVPPIPTEIGGVPSPLDHQALRLVIALTMNDQRLEIKIIIGQTLGHSVHRYTYSG
jgi:hypothetical protein